MESKDGIIHKFFIKYCEKIKKGGKIICVVILVYLEQLSF